MIYLKGEMSGPLVEVMVKEQGGNRHDQTGYGG
jgi:hypothetical protein